MDIIPRDILIDFLNDMKFSYSNILLFNQCKRCWYSTYILKEEQEGNFFSDVGTFVHSILEQLANGKIELFDIPHYLDYNWYKNVTHDPPILKGKNMEEEYFVQILDFFEGFDGFQGETVGTELEIETTFETKYGEHKFIGYIDRLSLEDEEYIVTDYKSKSKFTKSELERYSRQLYIYSKYIHEKYGKFPKYLKFLLFRENKEYVVEFNSGDYYKTIDYVIKSIEDIYDEERFDYNYNYFYCSNLCNLRDICTFD